MPLLFCYDCNHMLYPKEHCSDIAGHDGSVERVSELFYECRSCNKSVAASELQLSHPNMVTRRVLMADALESTQSMPNDVTSDPTLPRTRFTRCEECGRTEAVYYQSTGVGVEAMTLFFVCCKCHHRWRGKTK